MKHEHSSSNSPKNRSLDECFADKPQVRQRLLEIGDLIDHLVAQGCTAHEAEARAIVEIRKLGNGILTEWGEKSQQAVVTQARQENPKLQSYGNKAKKNS